MSFHSTLTGSSVWPADLATALSINAAQVYAGRRPQKVKNGLDVWLERLEVQSESNGGFNKLKAHPYNVHVRAMSNAGGNLAGTAQLTTVEAHLQTLMDRYDGKRVMTSDLTNLVTVTCQEGQVDVDDDDHMVLDGVINVTFWNDA